MSGVAVVIVRADGSVDYIDLPDARELAGDLGAVTRSRASHIVPCSLLLRLAFRGLRSLVADESRLASWSRGWRCLWRVEIVGGPSFGAYADRAAAIAAEVDWLNSERLKVVTHN